eukprot:XP_011426290.2 PREDICTED: C-type mannose receptor 2-like [Crassostrea gigas]
MKKIIGLLCCFVIYCVSASAALIQRPAGCPDSVFPLNLATFDQLCLQFNFEKIDWEVARNRCLSDGGDLIQIRTGILQSFLQQILTSQHMEKTGFWIGASDRDVESQWEWVTGDKNMTYSNWQDGQGTKAGKHSPDSDLDDCALMRVDYDFKWYDVPCRNKYLTYSYICEFATSKSSAVKPNHGCTDLLTIVAMVLIHVLIFMRGYRKEGVRGSGPPPRENWSLLNLHIYSAPADECPHNLGKSDLYVYGNVCLKVHYGNYDWVDARHRCQKEGGDLIQIRDSGMQQFLQRVLSGQRSEDTGFWIGASDSESESHWKWVAGDPKMTYSHWGPGQGPSQSGFLFSDGGHEDCALMKIHDGFRWQDYECSLFFYHYSFICQHDKINLHTQLQYETTTEETVGPIIG